jgi:hypothetical protein
MFDDLPNRPLAPPRFIPRGRTEGGQPHDVNLPQTPKALASLYKIALGEGSPIGRERDEAAMPPVRLTPLPCDQGLDLREMIDQVVAVTPKGLVRGIDALTVFSNAWRAVPVEPCRGQLERSFDPGHNGIRRIRCHHYLQCDPSTATEFTLRA